MQDLSVVYSSARDFFVGRSQGDDILWGKGKKVGLCFALLFPVEKVYQEILHLTTAT